MLISSILDNVLACFSISEELICLAFLLPDSTSINLFIFSYSQVLLQVLIVSVRVRVFDIIGCAGTLFTLTKISEHLSMDLTHSNGFKVS